MLDTGGHPLLHPLTLGIAEWRRLSRLPASAPYVCRDDAFADDVARTNMAAILEQHGIESERSP